SPVVQVMFALANTPDTEPELVGLTAEPLDVEPGVAKFDISVFLRESEDGIDGGVEYCTDLFDQDTVLRLWEHYVTLLRSLVTAAPDLRCSELEMIPDGERHRLLTGWNTTGREWGAPECLHGLVEAQADCSPEATAIVFGDRSLTYGEVEASANRLAAHLAEQGVGRGDVIGLYVERSPEMVVGLLAVLKAGAAYLPLDPTQPRVRLQYMLDDADVGLVLTQERLAGRLGKGVRSLAVDSVDMTGLPAERRSRPVASDDLAYVIYTSGSTGTPKGVMVEHRSIVNLVQGLSTEIGLGEKDRLVAVTTLAFDISALELFGPLSRGATVVIADAGAVTDGRRLADLVERSEASVMQATPSLWRMLLDTGWRGDPRLRVLCGGEALPPDLLERLLPVVGRVWNVYGPTESTVWSLSASLDGAVAGDGPVPIGGPVANTSVYVVDSAMEPVPLGVPGELLIGGQGVARGYTGLPGLTAERFVPDPFSGEEGARLYRTGDLVRYRGDGALEFLGRLDHQVKLRGYRIEPAEIENVLSQHPEVDTSAVIAREDRPGQARLVGYFTARSAVPVIELRQWLAERLPEYMVPSVLVQLDALPMTVNGKVDRGALPAPGRVRPELEEAYAVPRSEPERRLVELFAEVLDLPTTEVGVNDDFFALGGQSLLAVALVSRVCTAFDVDLPLSALFTARTAAALLPIIEETSRPPQAEADLGEEDFFTIPRIPRDGPLAIAPAQERLWFFEKLRPGTASYNEPLVFRLGGFLDVEALRGALGDVVARHEVLRSVFP
ncbi:amino acid adenylation domain-containing protein, partial [Nocardiopsis sp. NPDC049922]|uniref:non-ribosomal peptide synthetase n=1 Tax=Nocardiopsis sp. NPDC049922 TaxID=3155157 RepID=UPI0033E24289